MNLEDMDKLIVYNGKLYGLIFNRLNKQKWHKKEK